MKENLKSILKQYHIYVTETRLVMLEMFLQTNTALSYNYFFTHPSLQLNRVTIFRTLNLFVEKKIVHRIPAANGINYYSLQRASADIHSNFMCCKCKKIIPVKMAAMPKIKLPKGFIRQNLEITISGICNRCKY